MEKVTQKVNPFRFWVSLLFVFLFLIGPARADERKEKWFEEKDEKLMRAAEYADQAQGIQQKGTTLKSKTAKRWSFFGKTGYYFDDNVPLSPDQSRFRGNVTDRSAGRYLLQTGLAYNIYRDEKYRADLIYRFTQTFHDSSLNEFNFRDHNVAIQGRRALTAWDRPSEILVRYDFNNGSLNNHTYSSANTWYAHWKSEWKDNWELLVYESMAAKNFRNKGFAPSDSSRDGFYERTGAIQTFYFSQRKRKVYGGYEFGIDATKGRDWDKIANGIVLGFKTPLIEKVDFEAKFDFQEAYYPNYSGSPNRHDLKYLYEVRLSRPIGRYLQLSTFFQRTDVNTLHDGTLGFFNYDRNIYGVELSFNY